MNEFGKLTVLRVNDFKCIDVFALDLQDNGDFIPLVGPNGSGKSSVMEALSIALGGGSIPKNLIRDGKKESITEFESSAGYLCRLRIRIDKSGKEISEMTVTKNNKPIPGGAKKFLKDQFQGFMTPSVIATSTGASLYKDLIKRSGLDLSTLEGSLTVAKNEAAFSRRDKANLGMPLPEPIESLGKEPNFDIEAWASLNQWIKDNESLGDRIKESEDRISRLEDELFNFRKNLDQLYEKEAGLPFQIEKRNEMEEARDQRETWETGRMEWTLYEKNKEELETAETALNEAEGTVTLALRNLEEEISKARFPGGLRIDIDKNVWVDNRAWETIEFSRRMKIAAEIMIERMPEDKIPIMFIEHGESMSRGKRNEVAQLAIKKGVQVFMEIMNEEPTSKDGIVMTAREESVPEQPLMADPAILGANMAESAISTPPVPGMVKASTLIPSDYEDGLEIF